MRIAWVSMGRCLRVSVVMEVGAVAESGERLAFGLRCRLVGMPRDLVFLAIGVQRVALVGAV